MSINVARWIEGLGKGVSIIMGRYIDHIGFATDMAVMFITFFSYSLGSIVYHCIYGCTFVCFCVIL